MKQHWIYRLTLLFLVGCTQTPVPPERIVPIEIGEVTKANVPLYVEAIGNVSSLQVVQVRPQVGGTIIQTFVKQGAFVKKDEILYKIDPRPFQAALEKAKATLLKDIAALQLAETKVTRYKELVSKNYVSKLTFEELQTDVDLSKAQILIDKAEVDVAQLNVDYTSIKSPMDGRISQFRIDVGNLVTANDPNALTEIRKIDPAEVDFSISQNKFFEIQDLIRSQHLKVLVYLPEMPDQPREGEVFFIDNHVDLRTGTILLKAMVPNEDLLLWPGEFVTVRLLLKMQNDALLVPEAAVQVGQDGYFLYVFNPETSTVDLRQIQIGEKFDQRVVVTSGVKFGEKVVTDGQINLRPGAKANLQFQKEKPKESKPK